MDEILLLLGQILPRSEVPADRKHLTRALINRHDVRQLDPSRAAVRTFVLEALEVEVHMHLKQRVGVVRERLRRTLDFVHLLANFIDLKVLLNQVNVAVDPRNLHLANGVEIHPKHMRGARCRLKVRGGVRHNQILRGDEHRYRLLPRGVEIDLLER